MAETLPGYSIEGSWLGLFAPAHTPDDVVEQLNGEINHALKTPDVSEFLRKQGVIPMSTSVPQFAQLIRDDTARFHKIIKDTGVHVE